MNVADEWVHWAGEKSMNLDTQEGIYPKIERSRLNSIYTRLFYCYYTPKISVGRNELYMKLIYMDLSNYILNLFINLSNNIY